MACAVVAIILTSLVSATAATVTWVGGNGDWNTAANWSTGVVPGASDDVTIAAGPAITVTHSSGTHSIHSFQSKQVFELSGGALTVASTFRVDTNFLYLAGSLGGTTTLVVSNFIVEGNLTLNGETIIGNMDVGNYDCGSQVTVTNGLTLYGKLVLGDPADGCEGELLFRGTQTLGGTATVIAGNSCCGNNGEGYNGFFLDNGSTLTIGPGITITGQNMVLSAGQNIGFINQGTILDTGHGTMGIYGNWTNNGTICVTNSVLDLGGTFNLANLGTFAVSNATIGVTGTFINTNTLTVNSLGGTWLLKGGTILGGTVIATNGSALAVNSADGTLNGVTVNGTLDVGNAYSSAVLIITNGLTLNGTVLVGNPANFNYGAIDFGGSQTLSGVASVIFGDNASYNALRPIQGGTTLTLGAGVTVRGQNGWLGYDNNYGGPQNVGLINLGTIALDVAGGTINIGGALTTANLGNIANTASNITVAIGGVLTNTGVTLSANSMGGYLALNGGTLIGGTVVATNHSSFLIESSCKMDGVTVIGSLDIGATYCYAVVALTNGLTLNGTMWLGNATNYCYGEVNVLGTQTLGGNGTVIGGYNCCANNNGGYNGFFTSSGATLTIGPGITVTGKNLLLGYYDNQQNYGYDIKGVILDIGGGAMNISGNWTNEGAIYVTNSELTLSGTFSLATMGKVSFSNALVDVVGTLINTNGILPVNALGGTWMVNGGTIIGGTVIATNTASLVVNGNGSILNGVVVDGNLDVGNTYYDTSVTITNGLTVNGTLYLGNPTNSDYGAVTFNGSQTLGGNVNVVLGNSTCNAMRVQSAGTTLTLGPGVLVRGQSGQIGYSPCWGGPQNIGWVNQGTIAPDIAGTLSLGGNLTLANLGNLITTNTIVVLVGTLTNTGGTLWVNGMGGTWVVDNGTIISGTVVATNKAVLAVEGTSTFNGVTMDGNLDVGNIYCDASLALNNGLALNGTMWLGNTNNSGCWGEIYVEGTQTLGGNGTVIAGNNCCANQNAGYNGFFASVGSTMTFGPGITLTGVNLVLGWLNTQQNVTYINQGTILDVGHGTFSINGNSWINNGIIDVTNSTLLINGRFNSSILGNYNSSNAVLGVLGTYLNTNATLWVNGTGGTWMLNGGTILGGTVVATNGASLVVNGSGTLDGVVLNGNLDVGSTYAYPNLDVTNGLTLNGTMRIGNATNYYYGAVTFRGSQTFGGNATVAMGSSTCNALRVGQAGTTLTLGTNVNVRGQNGTIGYSSCWGGPVNVGLLDYGLISADVSGGNLQVVGQNLATEASLYAVANATVSWGGNLQLDGLQTISSQPGGNNQVGGNLLGATINVDQYLPQGALVLSSGNHLLEAMSADVGNIPLCYTKNFCYGMMVLQSGAHVTLVNQSTNSPGASAECVYVNSFQLSSGSSLNLNGINLYARLAQIAGTVTNGTVTQAPNNGGAITLGSGQPGTLASAGELDAYTFFGRAGHNVTVVVDTGNALVLPPAVNYADVQLLNPLTNLMAEASNTVAQQSVVINGIALPMDGTYTVKVHAPPNHASATGNYNVTVWDVTPDVATLVLNKALNGSIETPYSVDQWYFSAAANTQVRFDLLNESGTPVVFDLRGPGGWTGFTNISSSSDLVTLPASGSYTLTARGTGGSYGASYAFMVEQTSQTPVTSGVPHPGQLVGTGQAQLYRIDLANSGPLRISLSLTNGINSVELYAKFGSPPTRGVFDYKYGGVPAPVEQILVPSASAGSWYILVYGDYVPQVTTYSLEALQQSVFLSGVAPAVSGTSINTTLFVTGAGFDANTAVQLESGGTNFACTNLALISSTELSVLLISNSIPAGIYGACVSSPTASDCQTNVFTMIAGGIPDFHAQVIAPNVIGYHHLATLYIEYRNTGSAAMLAPLLTFTPIQNGRPGAIMTLNQTLLTNLTTGFWTDLMPAGFSEKIQILASGAVPGYLQPGEDIKIPVYYAGWIQPWDFSYPLITFTLGTHTADDTDAIDWTSYATNSRPAGLSDAQWANLLANLQSTLGFTWGTYVTALDGLTGLVPPVSGSAFDASGLFTIAYEQVTGFGHSGLAGQVVDVTVNQPVANVQVVAQESLPGGQFKVHAVQADGNGIFTFTQLPAGSYQMFVDGYSVTNPATIRLTPGQFIPNQTLFVTPGLLLSTFTNAPAHTNESSPAVAVDANGLAHLVWQRGSEVWHAYYDGSAWVATGPIPGATGAQPGICTLAPSNGVPARLAISWEDGDTNGSTLWYSVGQASNGPASWQSSSPLVASDGEAIPLKNDGLSVVALTNGQFLGVWQKRQLQMVDDDDLYFHVFGVPSPLTWEVAVPRANAALIQPNEDQNCALASVDFEVADLPRWLPYIGGKYGMKIEGELCGGMDECDYIREGEFQGEVEVGEYDVTGGASWKREWGVDSSDGDCAYVPKSSELTLKASVALDLKTEIDKEILGIGIHGEWYVKPGVNAELSCKWGPHDFSYFPDEGSGVIGVQDELGFEGEIALGSHKVKGEGSGGWVLQGGATVDPTGFHWKGHAEVDVKFEAEAFVDWFHVGYEFKREQDFPAPAPGEAIVSLAQGYRAVPKAGDGDVVTLDMNPTYGTTNVYGGLPVLKDVRTNVIEDGVPSLAVATGAAPLLAWTVETDNPTNWIGERVLAANFAGTNFSTPVELPKSRGFNSDVKAAFDSLGHPVLVWSMAPTNGLSLASDPHLVLSRMESNQVVYSFFNGTTWSAPAPIVAGSANNQSVTISKTVDGNLLAVWYSTLTDTNSGLYTNTVYGAVWNGAQWSVPAVIVSGQIVGDFAISPVSGVTMLFWTEDANQDTNGGSLLNIEYASLDPNSGTWSSPTALSAGDMFAANAQVKITPWLTANTVPHLLDLPTPSDECCSTDAPPDDEPPDSSCTNCDKGHAPSAGPQDPNAKFGPAGFGPLHYVAGTGLLPYRIEFENSSNATAPAQDVYVTDPLDPKFDQGTFELSEIGFGSQVIIVPPNSDYFETNVPMTYNGENFVVEIEAGLDRVTGEVYANFLSIDPLTDLPPNNILTGFLPPEDGTGRGQGFVSYFVRAMTNLPTGTAITNIAYIQFDLNPEIATDQADPHDPSKGIDTNKLALITIDANLPVSSVKPLPATETNNNFSVCWSGTDVGSGIINYDIYVSSNGSPWSLWMSSPTTNCETFTGSNHISYAFYSVAQDGAGNIEAAPASPDAMTTLQSGETVKPTLSITNPIAGQRITNTVGQVTVAGKAGDNAAVQQVLVQLNGGAWTPATTGNGWTNWNLAVTPVAGTNVINAYAIDVNGNHSITNQQKFVFVMVDRLTVNINGRGTVTTNYNGKVLQLGNVYTMTAAPAAGFGFINWTDCGGSLVTNKATLKFTMASNLCFTANFMDTNRPTLSITNMAAGLRVSNAVFTVKGKASDNLGVSNVWYSFNQGTLTNAVTENNWTNWTAPLTLVPGTNSLIAYAVDAAGNQSLNQTGKVLYVLSAPIAIDVVCNGKVSGAVNGQLLPIGQTVKLTNSQTTGFILTNWLVAVDGIPELSTNRAVPFLMESNLMLTATFADVQRPTLTVTAPAANQKMTNAMATFKGTASDNWRVTGVWYQFNGSSWNPAPTTNNWTNWSKTLTLAAGTNTIRAYAMDLGGNYSTTSSVSILSSNAFMLNLNFGSARTPWSNGAVFTLELSHGLAGHLEYSTNLLNWVSWTHFTATNSSITFRDPAATNSDKRYYRAVIP